MGVELQSLIDTHEQPFVVIDRDYRIVAANRRYCEAYGVTPEAIVGQHCHAVSHHSPRPCHENGEHCPHQALFTQGEAVEVLHTHFHADNQPERTRIRGHRLQRIERRTVSGRADCFRWKPRQAACATRCRWWDARPRSSPASTTSRASPKARPRSCCSAKVASARNWPHASSTPARARAGGAVHRHQLCCRAGKPVRKRTVRPRTRCIFRQQRTEKRSVRTGRRRHPVPRRGRRDSAQPAGEAACAFWRPANSGASAAPKH